LAGVFSDLRNTSGDDGISIGDMAEDIDDDDDDKGESDG
jgi:hypothetical protein